MANLYQPTEFACSCFYFHNMIITNTLETTTIDNNCLEIAIPQCKSKCNFNEMTTTFCNVSKITIYQNIFFPTTITTVWCSFNYSPFKYSNFVVCENMCLYLSRHVVYTYISFRLTKNMGSFLTQCVDICS